MNKNIAVCGAGISGTLCSSILASHGYRVSIFEIGRGPGGRTSSRRQEGFYFDHGCT